MEKNPQVNSLTATQHSAEYDDACYILSTESPIYVFQNQLIFKIGLESDYKFETYFGSHKRHIFTETNFTSEFLTRKLKEYLIPNTLNRIMTSKPIMGII